MVTRIRTQLVNIQYGYGTGTVPYGSVRYGERLKYRTVPYRTGLQDHTGTVPYGTDVRYPTVRYRYGTVPVPYGTVP